MIFFDNLINVSFSLFRKQWVNLSKLIFASQQFFRSLQLSKDEKRSIFNFSPFCKTLKTWQMSITHKKQQNLSNYALSSYFRRKHQNLAVVLDNQAVHNICERNLDIERPTYCNMNRLIAQAVSTITAAGRFGHDLNSIQTQLVPSPRLHYMLAAMAPINRKEKQFYEKFSLMELTNQVFEPANQLAICDPKKGKFISYSYKYRGDIIPKDVGFCFHTLITRRMIQFADLSYGSKFRIINQYNCVFPDGDIAQENQTLCLLSNSTAISTVFQRQNYNYNAMLRKKAFLHYFTSNGLEEAVFSEIKEDLASLERITSRLRRRVTRKDKSRDDKHVFQVIIKGLLEITVLVRICILRQRSNQIRKFCSHHFSSKLYVQF